MVVILLRDQGRRIMVLTGDKLIFIEERRLRVLISDQGNRCKGHEYFGNHRAGARIFSVAAAI
jgi:hypothetical protein